MKGWHSCERSGKAWIWRFVPSVNPWKRLLLLSSIPWSVQQRLICYRWTCGVHYNMCYQRSTYPTRSTDATRRTKMDMDYCRCCSIDRHSVWWVDVPRERRRLSSVFKWKQTAISFFCSGRTAGWIAVMARDRRVPFWCATQRNTCSIGNLQGMKIRGCSSDQRMIAWSLAQAARREWA